MKLRLTSAERAYSIAIYGAIYAQGIAAICVCLSVLLLNPTMLLFSLIAYGLGNELGWYFIDWFALTNGLSLRSRETGERL